MTKQWEVYKKQPLKGKEIWFQDANADGLIRRKVADESTNYVTTERVAPVRTLCGDTLQQQYNDYSQVYLVPKEMIYLVKKVVCTTTTVCK
jgi:hypothetical protein